MINEVKTAVKNGCKRVSLFNRNKLTSTKTEFPSGNWLVTRNLVGRHIEVQSTYEGSVYFKPL